MLSDAKGALDESDSGREFLSSLEYFLQKLLLEVHPEWKYESSDGILPFHFEQVNELEICLLAECILISDQSYVPLELNLQLAPDAHKIKWLSCKLGMKSDGDSMQRSPKPIPKLMHRIQSGREKVDWAYHVQFVRKSD